MLIHTYSKPTNPDRVVILGGNGFLGGVLLRLLSQNRIETIAPSSHDLDLSSAGAPRTLAEILRPSDALIMLAALKGGRDLDEDGFVANVAMGATVCRAVRQAGCGHVIYISSDALYPFTTEPVREGLPPRADTLYALMHLARETMLQTLDSPLAILRIAQVYGSGDPHQSYGPSRMIQSALREGRIVLYGSGEETRDHIHVEEVTSIILDVLMMRSRGLVNVASGRSVSFADLANLVSQTCGGSISIERNPRRMPVFHRSFDTAELQSAFSARARMSLEQGIALVVEEQRHTLAKGEFENGAHSSNDARVGGDENGFISDVGRASRRA